MFQFMRRVNEKDYYTTNQTYSWNEARNRCQLLGGDLVTSGMRNQTTREQVTFDEIRINLSHRRIFFIQITVVY